MELQTCLLFTTLVVCGADIRPAGWLDKVVAHWKKSFVDDFDQLGPFNLDASIESAPPGYQDSPHWDFDSVSRLLALLSVSETGQPTLNSLRRMIAPTRRMMIEVPGLTVGHFIPKSLYNNRNRKHRTGMNGRSGMPYRSGMNDRSGMTDWHGVRNPWKRTSNNRMGKNYRMADNPKEMANNRMAMASNRMGMANNRRGVAYGRMGTQSKTGRKQMEIQKTLKTKELSKYQMSFQLFPSIRDRFPNDIYYDEDQDYDDAPPEYDYSVAGEDKNKTDNGSMENAIVLVRNPVEARLPSARISVKLLKEILQARAIAARVMPPKKTTRYSWKPTDMTTPLNNGTSDDVSTAADGGAATGAGDDSPTTKGSGDGAANPDGGGEITTAAGDAAAVDGDPPPEEAPPEGRKMAVKTSNVAAKPPLKQA